MIKVVIPNYLKKVQLSKSRKAKYWEPIHKLPEKYEDKRYEWRVHKGKTLLYDTISKEFVVKNPISIGTPGYQAIAGNEVMRIHERKRMKIIEKLKEQFKKHIQEQITEIPQSMFPLSVSMEVHSSFGYADWDLDNLWIYHKCFLDTLTDLELIPQDNVLLIRQAGQTTFYPVRESKERKMIFVINSSPPECIPSEKSPIKLEESNLKEPGTMDVYDDRAVIYTGKTKVIFGAAKKAIRSVMLYSLNNFRTVFVTREMYLRYKNFFDENRFEGNVDIIIIPETETL